MDPALQAMTLDDGSTFYAYVQPDVSTFYPPDQKSWMNRKTIRPNDNQIAGRFVNLSSEDLVLMWIPANAKSDFIYIASIGSFEVGGTATFVGHKFCFAPPNDTDACVKTFDIVKGVARYAFAPYLDGSADAPAQKHNNMRSLQQLTVEEKEKLKKLTKNEEFAKQYRAFTGRDYLALHPRSRPIHYMWPAAHFDQTHTVSTKETHFASLPPNDRLGPIDPMLTDRRKLSQDSPRILHEYRAAESTLQMNLTVLSVAPRVFEIDHFLSPVEVDHILNLATGLTLAESTTSGNFDDSDTEGAKDYKERTKTRTSKNTWLHREHSPIIDCVYRRAADLLRIDEALLRRRGVDEFPHLGSQRSIAEALQLVHYDVGQEYTAHHDFAYPSTMDAYQPVRFATILLYLNEGMDGGETSFPRWINGHTYKELKVTPKIGKAVLFYSMLPDGNQDDLSQHAAMPVTKGEKWLTNLWVWEPIYG